MNPRTLLPHPSPSFEYSGGATSASKAPKGERIIKLAARAEAEASAPKASTRYDWAGMETKRVPKPTMNVPMIGTIQCTWYSTVHPYTNRQVVSNSYRDEGEDRDRLPKQPSGVIGANHFMRMRRFSGCATAPSRFCPKSLSLRSENTNNPHMKPRPSPRYARPEMPVPKPYVSWNTVGKVVKSKNMSPYNVPLYSESKSTIGEKTIILVGRTIAFRNTCLGVSRVPNLETSLVFPVSLIRRSVFRRNRTVAFVSRMKRSVATAKTPAYQMSIHFHWSAPPGFKNEATVGGGGEGGRVEVPKSK